MVAKQRLTFLVDSNVFMTLESQGTPAPTEPYKLAAGFARSIQQHGHRLAVHSGTREDVLRDSNTSRREHRLQSLEKYVVLEDVPTSKALVAAFPMKSANDRVDAKIASALHVNAAHYLVTEDRRLRRRVASAAPDLESRVLALSEALELLESAG